MTEKTEALRLADELDGMPVNEFYEALGDEAAAELRRLQALLEAEQALHQRVTYPELQRLRAQRDALLEALRLVQVDCQYLHHEKKDQHALSQPCPVVDRINAAIKAVEEGK